jgi:PKD repeat protein
MPPRLRFFLVCASLLLCAGLSYQAFHRSDSACRQIPEPVISLTQARSAEASEQAQAQTAQAQLEREKEAAERQAQLTTLKAQCAAFDAWRSAWQGNDKASPQTLEEGRQLAALRRGALKEIIQLDPELALSLAQDRDSAKTLPEEIREQLESFVDARGQFEVLAVCAGKESKLLRYARIEGTRYDVFTYGARLATLSKNQLPIHGIAIDGQLALSEAPFRTLSASEQAAQPRSAAMLLKVGGEVRGFPSTEAFTAWKEAQAAFEMAPGPEASEGQTAKDVTSDWVNGEKTLLWINAQFSDETSDPNTQEEIKALIADVNRFYAEVSRNKTSFKVVFFPITIKLPRTKAAYAFMQGMGEGFSTIADESQAAANAYDPAHGNTGVYRLNNYDRWIINFSRIDSWRWGGIAGLGIKQLWLNGGADLHTTAHELGHNQGLDHSHAWTPSGSSPLGEGTLVEYGDDFDNMGQGNPMSAHYNVAQKLRLGYLDASTESVTASKSGSYRIYACDSITSSGLQALHIKVSSSYDYWFELRQQQSSKGSYTKTAHSSLQDGVLVHWGSAPPSRNILDGTTLLQMQPGSLSSDGAYPLPLGRTFNDPDAVINVTPVASGGSGSGRWIDLYVDLGERGLNKSPSITGLSSSSKPQARVPCTLSASGSDPDGDALIYQWDFGDASIQQATASITHIFLKGGQYTVKCKVLDGRGGSSTQQSMVVSVSDPWQTWTQLPVKASSVFFLNKQFIAIAGNRSYVSSDGVNWSPGTVFTFSLGTLEWGLAYTGSRYVAVSAKKVTDDFINPVLGSLIASSSDGLKWREDTPQGMTARLESIAMGANKLVAVGSGGAIYYSNLESTAWTAASSGVTADLHSICFAAGVFIAIGENGTILRSTDAITWTQTKLDGLGAIPLRALTYFNGTWWLGLGNSFRLSTDSLNWSASMPLEASRQIANLSSNGSFIFDLSPGGYVNVSLDPLNSGQYDLGAEFPNSQLHNLAVGNGSIVVTRLGDVMLHAGVEGSDVGTSISVQPQAQTLSEGSQLTLSVTASGGGTLLYQWRKNGVAIPGATNASYTLNSAGVDNSGSYTVDVTGSGGSVTSDPVSVMVNPIFNGYLAALSVRSESGPGDAMLFMGVITVDSGSGTMPVMLRGLGPQLSAALSNYLRDPLLTLNNPFTGQVLASNDDWDPTLKPTLDAMYLGLITSSKDAALQANLPDGVFTVGVGPKNTDTGVVLADIYPSSGTAPGRLKALSVRSKAGAGESTLIVGFIISGGKARVLIRGLGPVLNGVVPGFLVDPKLELIAPSTGTVLKSNDNWGGTTELSQAFTAVALGTLPADSKDAALVINLDPGLYTANLTGMNSSVGIGIVEIYQVP